jgi:hypothetical protein
MHPNPLATALASVTLGPEVVVDNLTMIPLMTRRAEPEPGDPLEREYIVLDDALASGVAVITEISEQGTSLRFAICAMRW